MEEKFFFIQKAISYILENGTSHDGYRIGYDEDELDRLLEEYEREQRRGNASKKRKRRR